jgi:NAD(P)-dependent dehydrogenase (short-subunit alcohol dehydrogenase family)
MSGTYNLSGRGAIITGANQGLGRAIAEHYVRAGASVLLTARDGRLLDEVRAQLHPLAHDDQKLLIHKSDVSDRRSCEEVVDRARRELPGFQVLVNNAGVYGPKGPIEEVDWDEWVKAIEINLLGTVFMCRLVVPLFKSRGYGKIINLSGGGATNPLPRISAYAASKAAVVRMTDTLAEELKEWKIDVNAIAPGALNTRLLDEVLAAGPQKVGQAFYERSLKQQQQGGAPLDKGAELAVFLASKESDGITGRLISAVWDGWREFPSRREQIAQSDVFMIRRIVPKDRGMDWE